MRNYCGGIFSRDPDRCSGSVVDRRSLVRECRDRGCRGRCWGFGVRAVDLSQRIEAQK